MSERASPLYNNLMDRLRPSRRGVAAVLATYTLSTLFSACAVEDGVADGDSGVRATDVITSDQRQDIGILTDSPDPIVEFDSTSVDSGFRADVSVRDVLSRVDVGAVLDASPTAVPRRAFLIGDSTVQTDTAGTDGWGEHFQPLLVPAITVQNNAIGGTSTLSFYTRTPSSSNLWIAGGGANAVMRTIRAGDWVFIQFGHNDENADPERHTTTGVAPTFRGTYRDYLERYIRETRARGGFPLLITSVARMSFGSVGGRIVCRETHGLYPAAMKQVAMDNNVPLLDLEAASRAEFTRLGESETLRIFCVNDCVADHTHFNPAGAARLATLVTGLMRPVYSAWIR